MVKGYIAETMPFNKISDYERYLVVNNDGTRSVHLIQATPIKDIPTLRKMTKTFEIVEEDTEDVKD